MLIIEQEMALSPENQDWVRGQIRDAITPPSGLRKAFIWLREWGLVGVIVTAFLALVAISVTLGIFASNRLEGNAIFRATTEGFQKRTGERLDAIENTLRFLQASQSPKKVLQEIAALDKDTFVKNLPALRKVIEQPESTVQPSKPILQEVATKLRAANESTPDYWLTVLQFLRFASASQSDPRVPPPNAPHISIFKLFKRPPNIPPGVGWFRKAPPTTETAYLFDSVPEDTIVQNFHFVRCRIIFTNTPIPMQNVTFEDCVFDFPETETPNNYLQRAGKALLASASVQNVTIPTL